MLSEPLITEDVECTENKPQEAPLTRYQRVRAQTEYLIHGLSDADTTAQSMDDASPAKWHLAHTAWFFEEFIVAPQLGDSARFHPKFQYLFNSYYDGVGERHARPKRGLLTRPSLEDILLYRKHVDNHMCTILSAIGNKIVALLELGLAHEQQHQELLLTDLLHLFSQNPLQPALRPIVETNYPQQDDANNSDPRPLSWTSFKGGLVTIGATGNAFSFDCEQPQHPVFLQPFKLAQRATTNGEWLEFMEQGGYHTANHWLSDGFACAQKHAWQAPQYWFQNSDKQWHSMTLHGPMPIDPHAPVCHISYYEADAYARWRGARLPTEAEWEHAAATHTLGGHFAHNDLFVPTPQTSSNEQLAGMFGDVWEWTSSAYTPYPGFKPAAGTIGEYNGKFMSGQMVLRGGSCATPNGHIRASYRNFFHPDKRWQFSGLRLAKDADLYPP